MRKVITYGTYDLFHQGHISLLERAKALGDYLIVGVTSDAFDRGRGKLTVKNDILERIESVKRTGLADKIIIEEYVGQKIDDIQKYGIDIFAIGSDWEGDFNYLKEYCQVIYLERTEGISSTQLRSEKQRFINLGIIGTGRIANKFVPELSFVSGVEIKTIYNPDLAEASAFSTKHTIESYTNDWELFLKNIDAVYVASPHLSHYDYIKKALLAQKHVLSETPMVLKKAEATELFRLSANFNLVLMEANKTAHCPAFNHLIAIIKSGLIGEVVDIEASLSKLSTGKIRELDALQAGGSITENSSYPLLPIFKLLGTEHRNINFYARMMDGVDIYTKGVLRYDKAVASFKVGLGVKTEGNLIVSGTKGYAYVNAPWWKTDYFELRYEDQRQNRKFFYPYEGDGLRYELEEFISCINNGRIQSYRLTNRESIAMADVMERFISRQNLYTL